MLSFANEKQNPLVGTWKVDDEGGAFYAPFTGRTYASLGYFVSAWMPLSEPYEENAPKKKADITPVIDWIPCSERLPDKSDFYMVCAYKEILMITGKIGFTMKMIMGTLNGWG